MALLGHGEIMDEMDLERQFALLGIDPRSVGAYLHALQTGSTSVIDLGQQGLDPDTASRSLDELVEAGLLARDGGGGERYVPVPPEPGLRLLTSRREGELSAALLAVHNAYREARRQQTAHGADDLVEVVTGPAILQRLKQAEEQAQRSIRRFDSPPYYRCRPTNDTELEQLRRGIEYRVVYTRGSLARESYLETNIRPCIRAGEQARVIETVPVKLSIIDDAFALVSLSISEADVNRTLVVVRPSTLLSALVGLFEMCWHSSLPILPSGAVSTSIEPVEQRMLGLLASGLSDDEVVRTLRISRRTFFRYLERLQDRAGVGSRFQLGVYAARNGWLPFGTRQD